MLLEGINGLEGKRWKCLIPPVCNIFPSAVWPFRLSFASNAQHIVPGADEVPKWEAILCRYHRECFHQPYTTSTLRSIFYVTKVNNSGEAIDRVHYLSGFHWSVMKFRGTMMLINVGKTTFFESDNNSSISGSILFSESLCNGGMRCLSTRHSKATHRGDFHRLIRVLVSRIRHF